MIGCRISGPSGQSWQHRGEAIRRGRGGAVPTGRGRDQRSGAKEAGKR